MTWLTDWLGWRRDMVDLLAGWAARLAVREAQRAREPGTKRQAMAACVGVQTKPWVKRECMDGCMDK